MSKQDALILDAVVADSRPNTTFLVEANVGDKKHQVLATVSGKMRMNHIRIFPGDKVQVEVSPYDLSRGRIVRLVRQPRF
jgi:translation initiation factor IF-1